MRLGLSHPPDILDAVLARSKRPKTPDNYGVSGYDLLVRIQSRTFAEATNLSLAQAVGCEAACAKWQVTGYANATHGDCASSEEVRAILKTLWSLRLAMGMINRRLVTDSNETAVSQPEIYGPGGTGVPPLPTLEWQRSF